MAASDQMLFRIDTIVADGRAVAFEDGSATLKGVAGFENQIVPSASGPDYGLRKRVPRTLACKIQFGPAVNVATISGWAGIQVTVRDSQSGRRGMANNCQFGSMGDLGNGSVDLTLNILSPIEWL